MSPGVAAYTEENPADIQLGEAYSSSMINAVMHSPAWPKTALLFMYDEHGGYYDHVPPPAAIPPDDIPPAVAPAPGAPAAWNIYGLRVPAYVISPFAKRDYVSHVVHDHTSVLRFIETKFNLGALTRRDANADNLLDCFDFRRAAFLEPPTLAAPGLPASGSECSPEIPPPPTSAAAATAAAASRRRRRACRPATRCSSGWPCSPTPADAAAAARNDGGPATDRFVDFRRCPSPLTYLDHAASTPMRPEAVAAMLPFLADHPGNPSGAHAAARAAKTALEEARETVAEVLGAAPDEVVFTGGGTEADNLAVKGGARAARRIDGLDGVVTTAFEHKGVLAAAHRLEREGFRVAEAGRDAGRAGRPRRPRGAPRRPRPRSCR